MRVTRLLAVLALCAGGCHPKAPPSQPPDGGDPSGDPGDTTDTDPGPGGDPSSDPGPVTDPDPGTIGEFAECLDTSQCVAGLECTPWGLLGRLYCMQPCSGDTCGTGRRCTDGYCTKVLTYYQPPDPFSGCSADALPYKRAPAGMTHCAPICDVGNLVGYQAVPDAPACPALPASIRGSAPTCTTVDVDGHTAGLCVSEVAIGEICDQGSLRCNLDGARADTDPAHEATAADPYDDPGAPSCLPAPDVGARCLRVCSVDGGATTSPCACPAGDLCTDPADGLAWQCHGWSRLASSLRACVPVEDCTGDATVCADNTASGLLTCDPTLFTDPSPASTCQ